MSQTANTIILTLLVIPALAQAAPMVTEVNRPGAGAPAETIYASDVSASDLLQGLTGVESGIAWQTAGSSARLNNGVHGPSFSDDNPGSLAEIAWANPGSVVTFDLGVGANGLGYDISSVQSFAAWNGAGFGNQGYTLEFKPLGGVFASVATVDYNPLGGDAGATKVTITDDGGLLGTGIEAVRFTHNSVPGAVAGRITYRELDVIGQPTGDDGEPPEISSLSPVNGTPDVGVATDLEVTFNKAITIGTGDITIKNLSDATQSTIAVGDDTQVSFDGAILTIDPAADLAPSKDYAIQVSPDAIDDLAGNSFAGIADDVTWTFSTAAPDLSAPGIATLNPADDAVDVLAGGALMATFDELISVVAGDITVMNLTDATQATIAVTDVSQVSVDGAVLTINPAVVLEPSKDYALRIAAGAVEDLAGNAFAGIADDTTWNFSTADPIPGPTVMGEFSTTELEYVDDVSDSDLLHALVPSLAENWNMGGGATPDNLSDGAHGTSFDDVGAESVATIAWTREGATATYDLGVGETGQGWDLTSIQSIAAWNSANFGNQSYEIEIQRVGEDDFSPLASVDYQPLTEGPGTTKVTVTDTRGNLAEGVQLIRFTANSVNGGANNAAFTFREIDVEGLGSGRMPFEITQIIYEPSTGTVTLTWRSIPTARYVVRFSRDMKDWTADLDDGIEPDAGELTTRRFDISGLPTPDGKMFFRVERSE